MKIYEDNGCFFFMNYSRILDRLEPGNYVVKKGMVGFFLQRSSAFRYPSKIYGGLEADMERYAKAFGHSKGNLGIVLNGEKGSGKTLLSTLIARKLNLPLIKIEEKFGGTDFIQFINGIQQECIIFIDEFDKLYSSWGEDENGNRVNNQTELLKLMDGGTDHKRMFILTSNELAISEYMINRPSRIRYKQTFSKLGEEEVREVLGDKLVHKEFSKDFEELATIYMGFNLDTLLILIEEVNNYKESPRKLIRHMNIVPEATRFDMYLIKDGKTYEYPHPVTFKPLEDYNFPNVVFHEEGEGLDGYGKGKVVLSLHYKEVKEFGLKATSEGMVFTEPKGKYALLFKGRARIEAMVF